MPCCKDIYQWCKDEFENGKKAVYIDETGMEYCIFHAPKGKKGVSLEEFNNRVFTRISDAIKAELLPKSQQAEAVKQRAVEYGTICNLYGIVFEGDISFSRYNKNNPLPEISFWRAQFNGNSDFSSVTFSGEADFSSAKFSEGVDFNSAKFSGKANFLGTEFIFSEGNQSVFTGAEFSGVQYFIAPNSK